MSEIIIRKGYINEVQRNTQIQKRLDENIQNILNAYKYYDEKEEFKNNTGKDFDLIISHKSTIPDLVIFNKTFNKNNCFTDANIKEKNSFPRNKFYIRFNKKDKEKYNNLKKNKQNKQNKFNIEKNNQSEITIKENNNEKTKEVNLNVEKKEDNKNKNEENEDEEEGESEEDDDEEEGESEEDEEEEEDEKENDSKKDEKNEEFEGEEVKNNEEKKNNENNKKINFNIPVNIISKQNNNNNNQNVGFTINDNYSTASNTSKVMNLNTKKNFNDNTSNFDDISFDGSLINNINNIMETMSRSPSQNGNESFSNNNMNNNIGFNNINNNLLQLLLNQSQINNNNQFNNINNNNLLGLIGNNPLNLYNQSLPFQNNLNLQNNLLTQYTLKYWTIPGWSVFIKEENKIKQINSFTSFDLFIFLNQKIIENVKADDYIITTENKEQKFTGGSLYIAIVNIFPTVFNFLKSQSLKQIGLNNILLNQNNNNFGLSNANILNNLNNNNFLMNNFNNNNFNFNGV